MAVLLIEHHVEMVLGCCDRIYALQFGKVLASGTAEEIVRNGAVREAYLGASVPMPDADMVSDSVGVEAEIL